MTLNKDQAQHSNDELHRMAQMDEIVSVLKSNGPSTVAHISKVLGMDPWTVRELCESLVKNDRAELKMWRYCV